jgi:hypothetical protein
LGLRFVEPLLDRESAREQVVELSVARLGSYGGVGVLELFGRLSLPPIELREQPRRAGERRCETEGG